MQELEERKAATLGKPVERRIFPEGKDERSEPYANLRWSRFKYFSGPEMFRIVDEHVFPFLRTLGGQGTSYARHMRDARFQIPGPALLARLLIRSTGSTWATAILRATCTSTCLRRFLFCQFRRDVR